LSVHQKILFNNSPTNQIDYNTTWGQKDWADSTKIIMGKPYEDGPQTKDVLERPNSRLEESGG